MGQVNFRMTDERLALIDRAATIRGSCSRADRVRPVIALDGRREAARHRSRR